MFEKNENYRFPNKDFYEYASNYKNNDFNNKRYFTELFFNKGNKKRLYISITNKDQDANMYLSYDKYDNNIN